VSILPKDGIWEGKDAGYAKGHAELRKLFKSFQERISFSQHNVFNPRIEGNGKRAHAHWYFLGPFTFRVKAIASSGLRPATTTTM
jgi:hypothetical protein